MKKAVRIFIPLLLVLVILASVAWYLFVYDREFTRDSLLSQARFQDLHGNSRLSSWFYDMAFNFSGKDENVAIELANQYKATGNYTKAEYTLTNAISSHPTVELYTALCRTFVEQDKLMDAVNLLSKISDPDIKAQIDALRPTMPNADYDAGYYSQYMDLHLSSTGAIFYSDNGEFPSIHQNRYADAISLPAGETTIYAIAVSEAGLVSPVNVLEYTITGVIEEVTFVDPAMEAAIRAAINVGPNTTVYTNQLWELTEFTVPDGVASYSDLAQLPYLQRLIIQNKSIPSLEELSSLSQLYYLDLTGCKFPSADLEILANLPSLSWLILNNCGLSTIAGLAGAPNLSYLDLANNTVRNLEVLAPMSGLREVYLQHNAVVDLSALQNLISLEKLDVSFNALTTLSPLVSCIRLNWLGADHNQISDLSGINTLPLLSYLSLSYNNLTDVSALASSTELTELNIASNEITDISSLSTLTKLINFNFSSNQVPALPDWPEGCPLQTIDGSYNALTSIDGLSKMTSLTYVYMDYNLLSSVDALADNYCLVQVNVFGNAELKDVSALRSHDIIVNYDPTN